MSQKLIIFDMDGTLVDSSLTIANAINYVRKNLDLEPMEQREILKAVNDHTHNPAKTFYHAQTFNADHERLFSQYYTNNHEKELVLYNGIKEMLEKLKDKGYALAVATNAYRNSTVQSLAHLEITGYFDAIACYDDVQRGKPYPDMLYKILDSLKYSNKRALFIGDSSRDEAAAKNANIDYLMVAWGFTEHTNAIKSVSGLEQILLGS